MKLSSRTKQFGYRAKSACCTYIEIRYAINLIFYSNQLLWNLRHTARAVNGWLTLHAYANASPPPTLCHVKIEIHSNKKLKMSVIEIAWNLMQSLENETNFFFIWRQCLVTPASLEKNCYLASLGHRVV